MFVAVEALLDEVAEACAARDDALRRVALSLADAIGRDAFAAAGRLRGSQWLRAYTESSRDDARRAVSLGRLLAHHPATRAAVESGKLPIGRAGVLAAAVTDARRTHYALAERMLLEQAVAVHRVDDFEVVVSHWCALVDQDVAAPGDQVAQRLFLQYRLDGGSTVRGELDAATSEVVRAGLEAFDSGPDPVEGPLPPRSLSERRADALGNMAQHAVATMAHTGAGEVEVRVDGEVERDDQPTDGGGRRTTSPAARSSRTTNMVIDLPSLAGRTSDDLDGIIASIDGRPLSVWAVEQFLCGSWVAAVVTDAKGAVVDATERIADFTETQRRLIAVRDRQCVFPGCDAPPSWCDVHHLHWRSHGGGRHLDNGVLLCRRHHTLLHQRDRHGRGWTLERNPDGSGWSATSPTGRTWTGRPEPRTADRASGTGREPPDHRARSAA